MKKNLEMFRGDAQAYDLTVTTNGVATDISDWMFKMTVKEDPSTETDGEAIFQIGNSDFTITDGPAGEVRVTIAAAKTQSLDLAADTQYFYDIEGTEPSAAPHTIFYGKLKIKVDVTRGA